MLAKNLKELIYTHVMEVNMFEKAKSTPVTYYPYKTSQVDCNHIAEIMKQWKESGIITEAHSLYTSPKLLVNKSTGDKCLCIDYRKLNKQQIDLPYPIPENDEKLRALSNGKIFNILDLFNGYLQISLSQEAKIKSAFITPDETAQFERTLFELKTAPAFLETHAKSIP